MKSTSCSKWAPYKTSHSVLRVLSRGPKSFLWIPSYRNWCYKKRKGKGNLIQIRNRFANLYKIHRYRCKTDSAHILWYSLQGRSDRKQQLKESGSNCQLEGNLLQEKNKEIWKSFSSRGFRSTRGADCEPQFPVPHSGTSYWQLETDHGGSFCTINISKAADYSFILESWSLMIYQHTTERKLIYMNGVWGIS